MSESQESGHARPVWISTPDSSHVSYGWARLGQDAVATVKCWQSGLAGFSQVKLAASELQETGRSSQI